MENFGVGLVTRRLKGSSKSPKPETCRVTVALYVPGARVSAMPVVEKRGILGVTPVTESTVNHMGSEEVSTEKKDGVASLVVTETSALPAAPEPFT
jgi:hypothetical protein